MPRMIDADVLAGQLGNIPVLTAYHRMLIKNLIDNIATETEAGHGFDGLSLNEYQLLAARTINTSENLIQQREHALMGIASEAGEILGCIQKTHQGHALDMADLTSEMGDLLWMLAELATVMQVPLGQIARENIEKLKRRYPNGFEAERSLHREEAAR